MTIVNLWWIRRDLRLRDNAALQAAIARGGPVVPVFVLDPKLLSSRNSGEKRVAFLTGGLQELDKALRKGMKALVVVNKIDRPAAPGTAAVS